MGRIRQTLDRSQVTDDTPLRLDQAVDIFFYEGSGITVSSLRREHKRGRSRSSRSPASSSRRSHTSGR